MKFMSKFVVYDVLLCYNREIYTARSDDNNMAISTVSSYEKQYYIRPCVRALYSFRSTSTTVLCSRQFPQSVFKAKITIRSIFVSRVVHFQLISLIFVIVPKSRNGYF